MAIIILVNSIIVVVLIIVAIVAIVLVTSTDNDMIERIKDMNRIRVDEGKNEDKKDTIREAKMIPVELINSRD